MPDAHSIEISNAKALLPLIRGSVVAVYLAGREKPMTGLAVCGFAGPVLIARSNSSTHLIPVDGIRCIRFAPDHEPGRDPKHKLFAIVSQKHGQPIYGAQEAPAGISGPPKEYPVRKLPTFQTKLNRQEKES